MTSTKKALTTLEINSFEFDQLTEEEQKLLIKKKWQTLLLKYHPDRNADNPEANAKFLKIRAAFDLLSESESNASSYVPDINNYFSPQAIKIPPTAFDFHLREGIERSYNSLMEEFSTLTTEEDKRSFAEYYAPFLNIYGSLPPFDSKEHGRYFMERGNQTLLESMSREWRELVIRTYGKELLSDFKYRHALATGHLYPILAIYKLLSPLKALSLLFSGALILSNNIISHVVKMIFTDCIPEIIKRIISAIILDERDYKGLALNVLKLIGIVGGIVLSICAISYLPPLAFSILLGFSVISKLLEHLASPINRIARPLATRFGISPTWFIAFGVIASPLLVCGLVYLSSMISLLAIIPYITVALYAASCIINAIVCYELYKKNPIVGIVAAVMTAVGLIYSFITDQPLSSEHIRAVSSFFIHLISCLINYSVIRLLQATNHKSNDADQISASLPLPKENIPTEIEKATLLGYPNASNQSNRFFNTPKDAECVAKNDHQQPWKRNNNGFFSVVNNRLEYPIAPQNDADYLPT